MKQTTPANASERFPPDARLQELLAQGRAAQQQGNLLLAREHYEQAVRIAPTHPEALMMLGLTCYELGELSRAIILMLRALDLTAWRVPSFRQSLGIVLARVVSARAQLSMSAPLSAKGRKYRAELGQREALVASAPLPTLLPLVSIVILYSGKVTDLCAALTSVYSQSYRYLEVVLVAEAASEDDGRAAEASLQTCPFPNLVVRTESRDAHAALNEAIKRCKGKYINPLRVDERFAPDRIQRMVKLAERCAVPLVFGGVRCVNADESTADPFANPDVYATLCKQAHIAYCETVGHALLAGDAAPVMSNLFFSRALFDALEGFHPFRNHYAWDFCLRSLWICEPAYLEAPLLLRRVDQGGSMGDATSDVLAESVKIYSDYFAKAFDVTQQGCEFTPNLYQWGDQFAIDVLRSGMASVLPPVLLKAFAWSQLQSLKADASAASAA